MPLCIYKTRFEKTGHKNAETPDFSGVSGECIYFGHSRWLRERDLNPRPPGYEPDELPTALSRDIAILSFTGIGAGDRTRTGTVLLPGDFKSPVSTIPPHRRILARIRIPYFLHSVNPFSKFLFGICEISFDKKGESLAALSFYPIIQSALSTSRRWWQRPYRRRCTG